MIRGMPLTPSPSPRDRRFPPQALANEVRTELAASGLPILPPEYDVLTEQASGVSIEGDEEGVWVSWEVHGPLTEASQRAFQVGAWRLGNPDGFDGHPAMKHCAVSRGSMTEVLATILRSLGYGVQADADEYRVGELLVSPRALGAHWRDPAVPPLAGSAGYFPGYVCCYSWASSLDP